MILGKLFLAKSPGARKQAITMYWEIHEELGKGKMPWKLITQSVWEKPWVKGEIPEEETHKVETGGTNRSKQGKSRKEGIRGYNMCKTLE